MKHFPLIAFVAAALATGCSSGPDHVLFDSGSTGYSIAVDPQASECVMYAAEELQNWIREVSGVTLPITDLSGGQKGHRLVVGYNPLTCKLIKGIHEPDGINDSFTYQSRGGDVCLWGDTDRGTLYAVYSLLEKEFGCRWYSSRVSVTPKRDGWSFTSLYNHEVPGLRMRNDFYYDVIAHPDFAAKLRSNSTLSTVYPDKFGGSESYWSGHSLVRFVSVDEYFDEHPEYFSEIDGKRIKDRAQLCLSNPDVLRIVIDEVRKVMRDEPGYLVYSVSQGDWYNPCQCAECQKIKDQYGGEESGILLWFINQVADAVKDEFPDKFIGTFAYQYTRQAPENIKPRDNVVIRLCSIEECQLHDFDGCEQNRKFVEDLKEWSAIAPHLFIWDYSTAFTNYLYPLPNVWTFQNRVQKVRDNNAIGFMPEGSYQDYANAFEDMKMYVLAKIMWDPECDVDAVIKDFTDGYFGPAAGPVIREYMDFERKMLARPDVHQNCFPWQDAPLFTDEFITEGKKYFEKAKEYVTAAGENVEEYIARVEYAEVALCYLELMRNPKQGVADGSLDLFKRVTDRWDVSIIRENRFSAADFIKQVTGRP